MNFAPKKAAKGDAALVQVANDYLDIAHFILTAIKNIDLQL